MDSCILSYVLTYLFIDYYLLITNYIDNIIASVTLVETYSRVVSGHYDICYIEVLNITIPNLDSTHYQTIEMVNGYNGVDI